MRQDIRRRFWVEAALATLTMALTALTLVWRDWIEALSGIDPDGHGGALEWAVLTALVAATLALALAVRVEHRRSTPARS